MAAVPAPTTPNPFGNTAIATKNADAMVAVEQSRAIAEIQGAMTVAKRFPRDERVATDKILNACAREALAEQAIFTYARGGTDVTGPSIRLAEALAQCWGNIKTSVRELEQRDGASTVQAIAWDLETGYQADKIFQVKHWRDTKKGGYAITDARDIYELTANMGARRLRACILAVIPGDVIDAAVKQCELTLHTKAEVTPEALATMVDKFAAFAVTKEQIEKRIQRRLDSMAPAQLVALRKVYNSLKDGMSTTADWFELTPAADGATTDAKPTTATRLRDAAKGAAKPQPAKQAAEPTDYAGPDELATLMAIDKAGDSEIAALALDQARGAPFYDKAAAAYAARWVQAQD